MCYKLSAQIVSLNTFVNYHYTYPHFRPLFLTSNNLLYLQQPPTSLNMTDNTLKDIFDTYSEEIVLGVDLGTTNRYLSYGHLSK